MVLRGLSNYDNLELDCDLNGAKVVRKMVRKPCGPSYYGESGEKWLRR